MFGKQKKPNLLALYAEELKEDVVDIISWRRRLRRRRLVLFLNVVIWLLVGLLVLLLVNVLIFLPRLKNVYWQAYEGKGNLEKSLADINDTWPSDREGWQGLRQNSQAAYGHLNSAVRDLRTLKFSPLGWLPLTRQKLNDVLYLLEAGSLVSAGISDCVKSVDGLYAVLADQVPLDFSRLSQEKKIALMRQIVESQSILAAARDNLAAAQQRLSQIHHRDLLINRGIDLAVLETALADNEKRVARAATLAKALPILMGYPESADYLFLMQNNDELRPTGGFIGVYGLAKAVNGELVELKTSDVYHLDMPIKDRLKIDPPPPLKKYLGVENWYLRDSNWSPDWQTSAQKIAWFYKQQATLLDSAAESLEFDFIIGLTPAAVVDLLDLTGSIAIGGQVYNKNNFVELLQTTTGLDYARRGISSWDRKAVIADITKVMQQRILARLDQNWSRLLDIVGANLDRKNILVYAVHPTINDLAKQNGWRGEVLSVDGDYLMVVDANMAALKTDAEVNKSLSYSLRQEANGLVARVQINYANHGVFNWKTTRYRSFTRVYVPKGSQLIRAAGHEGDQSDVVVGEELGKTYFGAFVQIEPGKIGGLSFEYKLPYNLYALYESGQYSLLLQKQPGSRLNEVNIDCRFSRVISNYQPAKLFSYIEGGRFWYKGDFISDQSFAIKF